MRKGQAVRFTHDGLGLMEDLHSAKFVRDRVNAGDVGTYVGPHPLLDEPDWHVIEVTVSDTTYVCPVHRSMFDPIEGTEGR